MNVVPEPTRVLLVDTDHQQYLLLSELLAVTAGQRYHIIWCPDRDQALGQIERGLCDLVLVAYPRGDYDCGWNFLALAREKNNRIPIIVMTDTHQSDVDLQAISAGAADYLVVDHLNSQLLERSLRYARERQQIQERLQRLAHYDHLTGLPNRRLFLDRLSQAVSLSQRKNSRFTLLYIDIDNFKGLNDIYSHAVGDSLLQQFARRLQQAVRRSDTVARLGGDEFVMLLQELGDKSSIARLVEKIIAATSRSYAIHGQLLWVHCSIGIAVFPEAGDNEASLQRHADLAMYRAKGDSVSSYQFYSRNFGEDC